MKDGHFSGDCLLLFCNDRQFFITLVFGVYCGVAYRCAEALSQECTEEKAVPATR